jgi:DNA helicase II / ATP-dependent DNA helicase PcrA
LFMSFCQTRMLHGQTRYHIKSRFFDELPDTALKWLSPRQQGFGSGYARPYQEAWQRGSGLSGIVGAGRISPAPPPHWRQEPPPPPLPAFAAPAASTTEGVALRVGMTVFHNKFGEGVVTTLEGRGVDARAQIQFGRHGSKWLALSIAKLTPVV